MTASPISLRCCDGASSDNLLRHQVPELNRALTLCPCSPQAGLVSPETPEQLLIALEPEAASIYCRKLRLHQLIDLSYKPLANGLAPDRSIDSSFRQGKRLQSCVDASSGRLVWRGQRPRQSSGLFPIPDECLCIATPRAMHTCAQSPPKRWVLPQPGALAGLWGALLEPQKRLWLQAEEPESPAGSPTSPGAGSSVHTSPSFYTH